MTIQEKARETLKAIELTSDDSKTFESKASFGQQLAGSVGKTMLLSESDQRQVNGRTGKLLFTTLKFIQEDDETVTAKCTMAFDFQNIFLSSDPVTSLQRLGQTKGGKTVLENLVQFTVDKVTPTGQYPMRFSLAAQECGLAIDHTYVDADWDKVRAKYRAEDGKYKVARTDAIRDISRFEVQHIFVSARA